MARARSIRLNPRGESKPSSGAPDEPAEPPGPGRVKATSILLMAGALLALTPGLLPGQERSSGASSIARIADDYGIETRAIDRGLAYLASRSTPSGSIGKKFPVAVTSLAGLAFLGAGHSYREGPYTQQIEGCLEYILGSRDSRWFFGEGKRRGEDGESRMHGHCYALLFLTQIYGDLPAIRQREVRNAIRQGLICLLQAQSRLGGWDYSPDNQAQADEASITICALQALRAANNSGFSVPSERIDLAMQYVEKCQSPSGAFQYSLTRNQSETTFALTAAGLSTLQAAGIYDSPVFRRGMDYLRRELDRVSWRPRSVIAENFFFYGAMYTSQVFYQVGGESWRRWHSGLRTTLLRSQKADGSWDDDYGPEYATAMALLMLELPVQYLPIFQR